MQVDADPAEPFYKVAAVDFSGNEGGAAVVEWTTGAGGTVPGAPVLHPNRPNPFNPMTTIWFELPQTATVRLQVFDVSGRLVRSLIDGESLGAGRREVVWNVRDDQGMQAAAGVYFYHLSAGSFTETRRMTLVK